MNEEKILREEEKLYEKLLDKIKDRSSNEYKRIYRKLYYIRHRTLIKEYQKNYYKKRKVTRTEYPPPLTGNNYVEKFTIKRESTILIFE
jgi:hypothetical protein